MSLKFLFIIVLQIIIIFFLGFKIYQKNKLFNNKFFLNIIKNNTIDISKQDDLELFYEPKANSTNSSGWNPYKAFQSINNDTLNERFNYSIKKSDETFRIIALGDSFTYGLYVETQDNWTEKLENLLGQKVKCNGINKIEVINLGVPGYDLRYSVERFKIRGIKYSPDLVLWFIVAPNRINEKILPLLTPVAEQLKKTGEYSKMDVFEQHYGIWRIAGQKVLKSIGKQGVYDYQKKTLEQIKNYYNGKLLFLMEPWFDSEQKSIFIDFIKGNKNAFLFDKLVDTNSEGLHFLTDGHPNQEGHKKIAEDVFNYLIKNKVVPCN